MLKNRGGGQVEFMTETKLPEAVFNNALVIPSAFVFWFLIVKYFFEILGQFCLTCGRGPLQPCWRVHARLQAARCQALGVGPRPDAPGIDAGRLLAQAMLLPSCASIFSKPYYALH